MRFVDSVDKILAETPARIKGTVVVDQVYAHYQHEHPEFHHPDGGQAFYLSDPLMFKVGEYLRHIAQTAITQHGVDLRKGMIENVEDLSREVYERAPWEFADLRASGHPIVEEDGEIVYDRPPMIHRLSPDELAIKSHLRYLFDPQRYKR